MQLTMELLSMGWNLLGSWWERKHWNYLSIGNIWNYSGIVVFYKLLLSVQWHSSSFLFTWAPWNLQQFLKTPGVIYGIWTFQVIHGIWPFQVICFGFLLVLTPSNWDELLRRLVRYLFSKSTHAHSNNRYYVPYIITWYLLLYHVHSTKRHHIPYK